MLQHGARLLHRDAGEQVAGLADRDAVFQILEQRG